MLVNFASVFTTTLILLGGGYAIGWPLSKLLDGSRSTRLLLAPGLGFGAFGALALSVFHFLSLNLFFLFTVFLSIALASFAIGRLTPTKAKTPDLRLSVLWFGVAALVSLIPAVALVPQSFGDGVSLSAPVYDHVKVAIIDEIAQNGLPAHNPFFQGANGSLELVYYYLWYFIAACGSVASGATGWEADISLTWITSLTSIFVITWVALALTPKPTVAWFVMPLFLLGSLREVVEFISGAWLSNLLVHVHGLESWIYQSVWVPQHLFSATEFTLATLLLFRALGHTNARESVLQAALTGVVLASAFGGSAWVGGIGAATIFPLLCLWRLRECDSRHDIVKTVIVAGVAVVSLACASFVTIAVQMSVLSTKTPLGFWNFPVVDGGVLENFSAYWILLLPVEFGFIYILSLLSFVFNAKRGDGAGLSLRGAALIMVIVPFILAFFVRSVIVSNDFGWRIVLISAFAMMSLTASFLGQLWEERGENKIYRVVVFCSILFVLSPSIVSGARFAVVSDLWGWLYGPETEEGRAFRAEAPAMWSAVRSVTPSADPVANNPMDFEKMTPWPSNVSWALLARRRSCGADRHYMHNFVPQLEPGEVDHVSDLFIRVFDGQGSEGDLRTLRWEYGCKTLVVTPRDGIWNNQILATSADWTLAQEEAGRWRIYRSVN